MAAWFVSASSQKLRNSAPPLTDYPMTVGMWLYPTAVGTAQSPFGLYDTGTTNNYLELRLSTGSVIGAAAAAGGAAAAGNVTATLTNNKWHYVVGRFISATNRRIAVLYPDGSVDHGNSTTNRAPTGMDAMVLGVRETSSPGSYFDGAIAEFWITNTDIQADGAQLDASLLRQLAYSGPWSVPHTDKDIVDYRKLFSAIGSEQDSLGEWDGGAKGRQTWVNTNGVACTFHPPLASNYATPYAQTPAFGMM